MSRKNGTFFDMQFITSCISTMLVLMLLGMVVFFVMTANNLSVYVRENISCSVVLSDDMKEPEIISFQKKLEQKPFVKQTTYISKAQALKEQTEAMGTDPAEFLGYNPFTASIEIKLNSAYANTDSLKWIQEELLANKKVMEVNYPEELMDSVNRNIKKISFFLLGLAALLTFISFALINNTIRLGIYSKRFLIHTMKLVGASWSFIRRPFMTRHIWIGVLASAMADALLIGMAYFLVKYERGLLEIITPAVMLTVMGAVFVFGIAITSLCAYFSINKYLRMKVGDLYNL
ncbi:MULTISPECIES: cell division protein FtsX [Bacteroides]|uniref:Cell division protein FtsX n=2 Tax=Bacteroidaceae TaxID=815 RepID=A0ABT7VES3_9BACE|nr:MULTISPECIES: permease-like cell division protein FtsX [Bacteroides]MBU3856749.1 permease-like cell division protein FtsX [Candidatus Phocaeicola excrementipullorum]MBW9200278.1 FtsX-like permease family protein [Bacteroidales bacterium SW299]MCR8917187.1 permease-like cell division protein FtsX [Bacteroides sp. ET225]MDM8324801.1 permease-like cell division protein FtsX [Bacteroides gallinaceum]